MRGPVFLRPSGHLLSAAPRPLSDTQEEIRVSTAGSGREIAALDPPCGPLKGPLQGRGGLPGAKGKMEYGWKACQ
ncbi:hypothetical protein AAFF_G00279540 [Aldrovandia affinis]|uniref:Uncharacterized protein n=1 Tax=Aldrovandia affinis TaxID=143900 RepID=A0AAD7SRN5_9TELE|nr:hypothetical protein AAFF_G00279540 [Aldrovandia affinis]